MVRVTASDKTNTAKSATVTVGGVSATFSVTTLADVTPAGFTLAPVTNAALGATVTSAAVTLSGFDIAVPVSITGGEYSINGGAFTAAAGTVTAAQTVAVKLVASANHSTTTTAQLTVGGVGAGFSVTTLPDSTPDAFSFTTKTGAAINTAYTSDAITVKGIDTTVPVSITGGEYSINGGAFTSAAGTVVVNDTVSVKTTAANGTELTREAVLTIGGVSGTYVITTMDDDSAPVAEFKFPTPYTMSEANSVKVRGTASDEHGITAVKLVVGSTEVDATPKSETNGVKDFSSWTATIPLTANAENEIKVIATDDRNNTTLTANANKVTVRQADVKSAFPDEDLQFETSIDGIVYDEKNNQLIIGDTYTEDLIAINVNSGKRSLFARLADFNIYDMSAMVIEKKSNQLYGRARNSNDRIIFRLSLDDKLDVESFDAPYLKFRQNSPRSLIIDNSNPDNIKLIEAQYSRTWANPLYSFDLNSKNLTLLHDVEDEFLTDADKLFGARGGVFDKANNRYLFATGAQLDELKHAIIAVNPVTAEQRIFSNNEVGTGEAFSTLLPNGDTAFLSGLVINNRVNTLYVMEARSNKLIEVELSTGNRHLIAELNYVAGGERERTNFESMITLDESNNLLYALENFRKAVIAIDIETGEKVILSKEENDF
ncbi:MAG: hypothetical protein B0W54_20885 [Cellvibrio sp. 79]|nr:MAG: hypothetical protein B0W54_20885 [Cellvibrio sp. 79]